VKRCEHESSQFGQCAFAVGHYGPHGMLFADFEEVYDHSAPVYWVHWIACTDSGDGCLYGDHDGLSELLKTTAVEG
jgi:hypothetical protein